LRSKTAVLISNRPTSRLRKRAIIDRLAALHAVPDLL